MDGKAKKHPVWWLLVGATLCFAVSFLTSQGPLRCGSEEMRPGDKCTTDGKTRTYAEEKRSQEQTRTGLWVAAAVVALASVALGLARKAPGPKPDQLAWEAAFAQQKAQAIQRQLAMTPPEMRGETRSSLEQQFARVAAEERQKRGWADWSRPGAV